MPDCRRLRDCITDPAPISILINDRPVACYPGETVATVLLAAGIGVFRKTHHGMPRGPYCNMGVCFDCMVTVDGMGFTRACLTDVADGMDVRTGV